MTKKEIKNWKNKLKTLSEQEKQIMYAFFQVYQMFEMLDNIQDIFGIYDESEYNDLINQGQWCIKELAEVKGIEEQEAKEIIYQFLDIK